MERKSSKIILGSYEHLILLPFPRETFYQINVINYNSFTFNTYLCYVANFFKQPEVTETVAKTRRENLTPAIEKYGKFAFHSEKIYAS